MTPVERARELIALAEKATPGPWRWSWRNDDTTPGSIHSDDLNCRAIAMCPRYGKDRFRNDAPYIALASPEAITAICRALIAAEERVAELERENGALIAREAMRALRAKGKE